MNSLFYTVKLVESYKLYHTNVRAALGKKKIRKFLLQINSTYFSKMVLHNSRNKTIGLQYEAENIDVNKGFFARIFLVRTKKKGLKP